MMTQIMRIFTICFSLDFLYLYTVDFHYCFSNILVFMLEMVIFEIIIKTLINLILTYFKNVSVEFL